jgi:hypothetical protein
MQSSFSKPTREEEQQRILTPHEYIRDSFSFRYQDCISCGHRTEFTCIKCGYCYSCHWKREQVEEIELRDNFKDFYVSLPKAINDDEPESAVRTRRSEGLRPKIGKMGNTGCTRSTGRTNMHLL